MVGAWERVTHDPALSCSLALGGWPKKARRGRQSVCKQGSCQEGAGVAGEEGVKERGAQLVTGSGAWVTFLLLLHTRALKVSWTRKHGPDVHTHRARRTQASVLSPHTQAPTLGHTKHSHVAVSPPRAMTCAHPRAQTLTDTHICRNSRPSPAEAPEPSQLWCSGPLLTRRPVQRQAHAVPTRTPRPASGTQHGHAAGPCSATLSACPSLAPSLCLTTRCPVFPKGTDQQHHGDLSAG